LEGAAGGETRRGERRQRGERARALKAVRTQHKPNNRSIGSGPLEEGNWWQDRALTFSLPLLCSCLGSRRTEQQSEATHVVKPQGARGTGRNKIHHFGQGGAGESDAPLSPLECVADGQVVVCCLGLYRLAWQRRPDVGAYASVWSLSQARHDASHALFLLLGSSVRFPLWLRISSDVLLACCCWSLGQCGSKTNTRMRRDY
jgi:hypothetical protein